MIFCLSAGTSWKLLLTQSAQTLTCLLQRSFETKQERFMKHRYGTKSMGVHGRPNCLLTDWPTSWMISFNHWAWEVWAYFLQSNFISENSTGFSENNSKHLSGDFFTDFFRLYRMCSCSAVSLKKRKKTGLHLLSSVENFLHLRQTQLPEMIGEVGTLTNKLGSSLDATKYYHLFWIRQKPL